jgi:hypothetical protein
LDAVYAYFRSSAVANFPDAEKPQVRRFGVAFADLDDLFLDQVRRAGGVLPADALCLHNKSLGFLDIEWEPPWTNRTVEDRAT